MPKTYNLAVINLKKKLLIISILFALTVILLYPNASATGVEKGLIISSKVIIPSLFPITFCVTLLMNFINTENSGFLSKVSVKIFNLTAMEFIGFLLSLIGGYPIGAKIISELYDNGKTNKNNAITMQNYCVNAGPAFIIIAVGIKMFHNIKIGFVLFASHILSSIIIAIISKKKIVLNKAQKQSIIKSDFAESFVNSAASTSSALIGICFYVTLFSVIGEILDSVSSKISFLKFVKYFLEITNALNNNKNVYVASFLLGFAGFCIWLQIFSINKEYNIKNFVLFRILHGLLSMGITFLLIKTFKISVETVGTSLNYKFSSSRLEITISLFILSILFVVSLSNKKFTGKIIKDLI